MTTEMRVAVAAGGVAGTALRMLVAQAVDVGTFPLATLLVNLAGAYALAWLAAALPHAPARVRAFLGTGLLGSFTTFSALAVDVVALGHRPLLGALYAVATLGGGLALARLGLHHGDGGGPQPAERMEPEVAA